MSVSDDSEAGLGQENGGCIADGDEDMVVPEMQNGEGSKLLQYSTTVYPYG